MPLYLVRWPNLSASIIKAPNEGALLHQLDDVEDPGSCTWSIYDGPVWIDLEVPVEYIINEKTEGRLRADEVTVTAVPALEDAAPLLDAELDHDTQEAVLRAAFPHLYAALPRHGEDDNDDDPEVVAAALREAAVKDLVAHAATVADRSVTYGAKGQLRAAVTRYFRRAPSGDGFEEVPGARIADFCRGLGGLVPDGNGHVHVVGVTLELWEERPVAATVRATLRLRTDADGLLVPEHRIVAGERDADEATARRVDARNEAVYWAPDPVARVGVEAAVRAATKSTVALAWPAQDEAAS